MMFRVTERAEGVFDPSVPKFGEVSALPGAPEE